MVVHFFIPTNENAAETIEPPVGSFDDPTSRAVTRCPIDISLLLTPTANMSGLTIDRFEEFLELLGLITLVQTEVLF